MAPTNLVDEIHAALARHAQIRDDDLVGALGELAQGTLDRRHPYGLVTLSLEQGLQHMPQVLLVIDDEHTTHGMSRCGCIAWGARSPHPIVTDG